VIETAPPWQKLYVLGKPKPCKFRGIIETCFGTFPITNGMRETCDNPACKKRLRALSARPANSKWAKNNRPAINARRKANHPAKRDRINELRRVGTAARRKLKPCEIASIADAKLPTDGLRAAFAEARKTCLGSFYPKGKQQTCSKACSDALGKLGHYGHQLKWNRANKNQVNAAKEKWRAGNKAAGRAPDVGARRQPD
jgi:hypothetical protein